MSILSKRMKQVMDEKGISQTELCAKTGIGKSSISQYLSGKNIPASFRLKQIADVLGVPVDWLIGVMEENKEAEYYKNLTPEQAAKLMGVGTQCVRQGLKNSTLPFGWAIKMPSGKFRYYISLKKFTEYTGIEVDTTVLSRK